MEDFLEQLLLLFWYDHALATSMIALDETGVAVGLFVVANKEGTKIVLV